MVELVEPDIEFQNVCGGDLWPKVEIHPGFSRRAKRSL
jgi:hypothetical protein